jgi:hypothetical protein
MRKPSVRKIKIIVLTVLMGATSLVAQHDHAATPKVSAGATSALTAEQIAQLLAGDGMGLAKPAELNHYPGPKHVLELADDLKLTDAQRRDVEGVRSSMLASAKSLGAQIVEIERTLDHAFSSGQITAERLRELTATAGRLHGELRAVHLKAHLQTRELLSTEQIKRYDVLRGYVK